MTTAGRFELGQAPTTKEAQAIADALYSEFVGLDVDKVELIYTKFVSLISSDPIIQTLLPLTPQVCTYTLTLTVLGRYCCSQCCHVMQGVSLSGNPAMYIIALKTAMRNQTYCCSQTCSV